MNGKRWEMLADRIVDSQRDPGWQVLHFERCTLRHIRLTALPARSYFKVPELQIFNRLQGAAKP